MSADHAQLAPSAAHRWSHCPGSVALRRDNPDLVEADDNAPNETRLEGLACHHASRVMLEDEPFPYTVGEPTPDFGVIYTEEMHEAVMVYVEYARKLITSCEADDADMQPIDRCQVYIERPVTCLGIHSECWGTPDLRILHLAKKTLHIVDAKFGFKYVDVLENEQEMCYSEDVRRKDIERVVHHIVQPRAYGQGEPTRSFVYTKEEVQEKRGELAMAALQALGPDPECVTGMHCTNCAVRQRCVALAESGWLCTELAASASSVALSAEQLPRELSVLYMARSLLDSLLEAREEEAISILRSGTPLAGFELKQGYGRERWTRPVPEIVELGKAMGIALDSVSVCTPKQAISKGLPSDLVRAYSETPQTSLKLARTNSSRARLAFQQEDK